MNRDAKIFIAGHNGMVGSAIVRWLKKDGFKNFILKTSQELDLRNQSKVQSFLKSKSQNMFFGSGKSWRDSC